MLKKIFLVVGARPNFIKSAPLCKELARYPAALEPVLIHTGQHYDRNLSELFFEQLKMPEPDIYLGVGSGTHADQTARIMVGLEKEMISQRPELVVVFGDVNSTLAAAVTAAKLCIKIAHVEAGLRSFDNSMPEEINRIVTDRLSEFLFVTEPSGVSNLSNEGVPPEKIHLVGNIMIDSLIAGLNAARASKILDELSLKPKSFALLTLHRPSNVDNKILLESLLEAMDQIGARLPVVFPCHPRTRENLTRFGLGNGFNPHHLRITEPLGYLDFLKLQCEAKLVLTDSGGIQEETTYLGIPCLTLRQNTERPITVELGTNTLTGVEPKVIAAAATSVIEGNYKTGSIPDLWEGNTASRIVNVFLQKLT